jgi:hypothetical protein
VAEDVSQSLTPPAGTVIEAEPARPRAGRPLSRSDRARRGAYRHRFAAVYFVLAAVAGVAIGIFVVLMERPAAKPPPRWSSFVPTGSPSERVYQIATQIPKRYRRENGEQLVGVAVEPPQAQLLTTDNESILVPIRRISLEERGDIRLLDADRSLQFTLCGQGKDCAIEGKPSELRYYLVQREAVELSLYALKYLDGLESVTVLLPPSKDVNTQASKATAVFLRQSDVQGALSKPLAQTLPSAVPGTGTTRVSQSDLQAVRKLGFLHTFTYSVSRAQDGTWTRVLQHAV